MPSLGRTTLADILRTHQGAYLAKYALPHRHAKVWRAIVGCRTAAMGGHIAQCNGCGAVHHHYHSCRNRHCPQCQSQASAQWSAARQRELLPVPYTHFVFTLPHALNGLAASHFKRITDLLFDAAATTLLEFGSNPRWLGGTLALSLVLHTWQQNLLRHMHVHALVANGALGPDGQWIHGKPGFLFPEKALSKVFREKFMDGLKQAKQNGLFDDCDIDQGQRWRLLLVALRKHDWVVYAKQPLGGPGQVLDYLARYTHRVAISNDRIVSMRCGEVRFRVRDNAHPGKKRVEKLPAEEFIRRYLQHVLPSGYKRIRHYGILANGHKRERLAQCRAALDVLPQNPAVIESVADFMLRVAQCDIGRCPYCAAGKLVIIGIIAPQRPSTRATGPPT